MNCVKELRLRAGMQQKEIAIAVGVSRPTVSEWEHQKKDPTGERLKKLAALFDVPTGVVLGMIPIPNYIAAVEGELPESKEGTPRTPEARIVSGGMDKLPKEQREQILNVVRAMFSTNPDLFTEKG